MTVRGFLLWLNVLSLDAPLVALVWQDFFARNFQIDLPASDRVILALSIWLAYAADRWLDGWKIPPGSAATPRHRFARQQRRPLAVVWLVVLGVTVVFAWQSLPRFLFQRGLTLVLFVSAYFIANQIPAFHRRLRGFKEVAVAVLFAAGTVVFVLPQSAALAPLVWWPVIGWGMLCFLNCYAIAIWELDRDRAVKQESIITRWPSLARGFKFVAGAFALAVFLPALFQMSLAAWCPAVALAASSLCLAGLDCWSHSADLDLLRVAADLSLLTPLIFRLL